MVSLMRIQLKDETDIVNCRQRARQIANLLQLDTLQQTHVATAVSEIARNALRFAGSGMVNFRLKNVSPLTLMVTIEDNGPGILNVDAALTSSTGMGLKGSFRLMDICEITSSPGAGTRVVLGKVLSSRDPLTSTELNDLIDQLLRMRPSDAMGEIRQQNTELLVSLEELKKQKEVALGYQRLLEELNKELADTNRGVIALNTELEDQAKTVSEASEMKARFLSHVTHEFRTPVNSILSMSRILLASANTLDADQAKQVGFIRKAAEGLSEMVNDLLDTVKAEAGKLQVNLGPVRLSEVFDTLRALFRPLMPSDRNIQLIIDDNENIPIFISDETKISQIVRNFISNSLKFTEDGQIIVTAELNANDQLEIAVRDSGIGIAKEHQGMIFEEFMQVHGAHQKRSKGTGLGLPLARRLARLLDGDVTVESNIGSGSVFKLQIPFQRLERSPSSKSLSAKKILVIDDDEASHYTVHELLKGIDCETAFALTGKEGLKLVKTFRPDLIVLDVSMPEMDGIEVLRILNADPQYRSIPVLLNSSMRYSMDDFPHSGPRPNGILNKDKLSDESSLALIVHTLEYKERGIQ
jgi:signal transduction histidine kinase